MASNNTNAASSNGGGGGRTAEFPKTFEGYRQELLDDELFFLAGQHQALLDQLEQSTVASEAEYRYKLLFLEFEHRRRVRLAHKQFGGAVGEIMVCGADDMTTMGLHPTLRNNEEEEGRDEVLPKLNDYLSTKNVRAVASGGMHSCLVDMYGVLWTFGNPDKGVLGRPDRVEATPENMRKLGFNKDDIGDDGMISTAGRPGRVKEFISLTGADETNEIIMVAAGESHTLAVSADGTVYQFGFYRDSAGNEYPIKSIQALDINAPIKSYQALDIDARIETVYAKNAKSAAIDLEGHLWTWGFGDAFDIGRNSHLAVPEPNGVLTLQFKFLCDGMSDETREPFMQQHFLTPKRIEWPAHLPNVKRQVIAVGMGEVHLLVAVREGGSLETKVYACGHNEHGQLGLGHRDSCSELTHVPFFDDKNITEFACGGKFSLALSIDGKALYSFGRSDLGALGNRFAPLPPGEGDSSNANPEQVKFPTISPIVKISAGINHCLAVTEDNKVYSWGGVRGYVTGFSEYRVFTGPRNYGDGDGPTEYESFPDEDIRAPTHLNLADYSNGSTDCVKVFEACAGDINSLFLVHRMKRADDAGTMDGHQAKKNRTS